MAHSKSDLTNVMCRTSFRQGFVIKARGTPRINFQYPEINEGFHDAAKSYIVVLILVYKQKNEYVPRVWHVLAFSGFSRMTTKINNSN